MNPYHGKAIYNPSGKAGEYTYWACNFYNGCSGRCSYCFLKKGVLKHTLGGDKPKLKACFRDVQHAKDVFVKEMFENQEQLQENGLLFSFTSDFLPETTELLLFAIKMCLLNGIPVKTLSKQTAWLTPEFMDRITGFEKQIAFGFTLTGHDEDEPRCATNEDRISTMYNLSCGGFLTWASIEPIISYKSSFKMIYDTRKCCDLYKIGLQSGEKYDERELNKFMDDVYDIIPYTPIYWKDSLVNQAYMHRSQLRANSVTRDFNLFKIHSGK